MDSVKRGAVLVGLEVGEKDGTLKEESVGEELVVNVVEGVPLELDSGELEKNWDSDVVAEGEGELDGDN